MNIAASPQVVSLPIDAIDDSGRLRPIDSAHVELIAASIEELGLRSPIEVAEIEGAPGSYVLLAGAHRLAAVRSLGRTEIDGFVREAEDETLRRLLEIDENLCRHDLNALDRCVFMERRRQIYERLHQPRRRGGPRGDDKWRLCDRPFADDTAERIGRSKRQVRHVLKLAERLPPRLRAALAGTRFALRGGDLTLFSRQIDEVKDRVADLLAEDHWRRATAMEVIDQAIGSREGKKFPSRDPVVVALRLLRRLTPEQRRELLSAARKEKLL